MSIFYLILNWLKVCFIELKIIQLEADLKNCQMLGKKVEISHESEALASPLPQTVGFGFRQAETSQINSSKRGGQGRVLVLL